MVALSSSNQAFVFPVFIFHSWGSGAVVSKMVASGLFWHQIIVVIGEPRLCYRRSSYYAYI